MRELHVGMPDAGRDDYQWNPSKRRYRTETFCYGPFSCPVYESGPVRKVPGRHGMTYTEEDWVDVEATSHRRLDE